MPTRLRELQSNKGAAAVSDNYFDGPRASVAEAAKPRKSKLQWLGLVLLLYLSASMRF